MDCPGCKYPENHVLDTRPNGYDKIKRRRQCIKCGLRFTTDEFVREPKKKKDVKL